MICDDGIAGDYSVCLSSVESLALLGALFGFTVVSERLDSYDFSSVWGVLGILFAGIGGGIFVFLAISAVIYFLFFYKKAALTAANLRVIVEGPFFRIINKERSRTDRKLHFRSIVDYTTFESPLMKRYGLMELQMTTTGGYQALIRILGIKNCSDVRDKLSETDALRENG